MCFIIDSSVLGIHLVSLYVGTMTKRSAVAGSSMYGRGIDLLGDVWYRFLLRRISYDRLRGPRDESCIQLEFQ